MRALKILVWGMGVLIIAASVALVVMIVQRAGKAIPAAPEGPPAQISLGQPPGSRIAGLAPGFEGRVAVWVQRPDGERLVILDTRNGRALGEIRLSE
ncbi:hypothetical protein ACFQX4_14420 [Roseomonas sp. GCM10028921]|uniref:Uncharacterized protein n=1 Tax=Muricoccus pecuniae TaxID=693023 RepID=A0A840YAI4_9PROT|nr:hypothetical protein [Roseomonas pecuniae]MBB5693041.1 hypothetical protein [Roseomonas pecuniae]